MGFRRISAGFFIRESPLPEPISVTFRRNECLYDFPVPFRCALFCPGTAPRSLPLFLDCTGSMALSAYAALRNSDMGYLDICSE